MSVPQSDRRDLDLGTLELSLGYHLRRAQLQIFEDLKHSFAELGLRPTQFSVLVLINKNDGVRQSEIADALGILRTNFVDLVEGLQQRGLVERRPSQRDRRSFCLQLTTKGSELLARAILAEEAQERRLAAILGAESAQRLRADLAKLWKRLSMSERSPANDLVRID